VLRKPPQAEREAIEKCIEQSMSALDLLLAGDMERAMMKVHARPPRPKPPAPSKPADAVPRSPTD
jgi:PTH1 family peptidyl-tRNA hydrolase